MGKTTGPDRDRLDSEMRLGWRMAGIGMEVAAQVAAGALLGWLFDRWQGSSPTGLLTGAVIGIVVGLWSLIRGALQLNRYLDLHHPTAGRGRPLTPQDRGDATDDWSADDQHRDPD